MDSTPTIGERVRGLRKSRGLTQVELARLARLSIRTVKTVEQDAGSPSVETLAKIARGLHVDTSVFLVRGQAEPQQVRGDVWGDVHDALYGRAPTAVDPDEPATPDGVLAGLSALGPYWEANQYSRVRGSLAVLLRDALSLNGSGEARVARSRVLNAGAWLLTMTRQFDDAETAGRLALDAAPDLPDSLAAVSVMSWCLLRQGRLAEAGELAVYWADRAEPRFSTASTPVLAGYGKVLLYVNNALIRDNRPGDADDALSLARAAAAVIGRDVRANASTTMTFGPAQVQVIAAENAALEEQPERVLAISERLPAEALVRVEPAQRLRHQLDVASAKGRKRDYAGVVNILQGLRKQAPEWLPQQQYARDILGGILRKRRGPWPDDLKELAEAVRLPPF